MEYTHGNRHYTIQFGTCGELFLAVSNYTRFKLENAESTTIMQALLLMSALTAPMLRPQSTTGTLSFACK